MLMRVKPWNGEEGKTPKEPLTGNSLAVQWLGLCLSLPRARVQSLFGVLRSQEVRQKNKTKQKTLDVCCFSRESTGPGASGYCLLHLGA